RAEPPARGCSTSWSCSAKPRRWLGCGAAPSWRARRAARASPAEVSVLEEPASLPRIPFPTTEIPEISAWQAFIQDPLVKALVPVPVLLLAAPVLWAFFRSTWQAIEQETRVHRSQEPLSAEVDYRPAACLLI